MPGVVDLVTSSDVTGSNTLVGSPQHVFFPVGRRLPYVGAPVALVLADSRQRARAAAKRVRLVFGEEAAEVGGPQEEVEEKETCRGSVMNDVKRSWREAEARSRQVRLRLWMACLYECLFVFIDGDDASDHLNEDDDDEADDDGGGDQTCHFCLFQSSKSLSHADKARFGALHSTVASLAPPNAGLLTIPLVPRFHHNP